MHKTRLFCLFLSALLCCVLTVGTALPASAEEPLTLASEAAVVMDTDTLQVVYEKNSSQLMYPASITKVMTALLVLEKLEPEQVLTVSQQAYNSVPRTSSHISLEPGEQLTVEQAMYALAMESANDAANVLAEGVSGDLSLFAQEMTRKAQELGAFHTHFTNANGLPEEEHYTTAYDMALITAAALKTPGFTQYFSTVEYELPATNTHAARSLANKNRILPGGQYFYEGVLMGKTGWTSSALGTFVTAVRRGSTTLIVVALKSPMLEDKYQDTHALLNYVLSKYYPATATGKELAELLPLGNYAPAPGQEISFLLPLGTTFSDVDYTIMEGVDLQANDADTLCITVAASIRGLSLPYIELQLEKKAEQEVLAVLASEVERIASEAVSDEDGISPLVYISIAVLLLSGGCLLWHFRKVSLRRRKLENRILKMKKEMEE